MPFCEAEEGSLQKSKQTETLSPISKPLSTYNKIELVHSFRTPYVDHWSINRQNRIQPIKIPKFYSHRSPNIKKNVFLIKKLSDKCND